MVPVPRNITTKVAVPRQVTNKVPVPRQVKTTVPVKKQVPGTKVVIEDVIEYVPKEEIVTRMVAKVFTRMVNVPHVETAYTTVPTVDHVTDLIQNVQSVLGHITRHDYVNELVPVDVPVVANHLRTSLVNVPICHPYC